VPRVEIEEAAPGVRLIAFNRPEVRNAFDTAMYQEVTAALRAADGDETVGAVVLTGRARTTRLDGKPCVQLQTDSVRQQPTMAGAACLRSTHWWIRRAANASWQLRSV